MMRTMYEILTEQYPNVDWNALDVLPIMYLVKTDEYRVIEARWPTDIYPTIPTPSEISGWLE